MDGVSCRAGPRWLAPLEGRLSGGLLEGRLSGGRLEGWLSGGLLERITNVSGGRWGLGRGDLSCAASEASALGRVKETEEASLRAPAALGKGALAFLLLVCAWRGRSDDGGAAALLVVLLLGLLF